MHQKMHQVMKIHHKIQASENASEISYAENESEISSPDSEIFSS